MAVWFFDDGHADRYIAYFYPMAFADRDVVWLQALLDARYGIPTTLRFNANRQPLLYVPAQARERLKQTVSQFGIPGMGYKTSALAA